MPSVDPVLSAGYLLKMKDSEFRRKLGVVEGSIGRCELGPAEKKALGQALKGVLRSIAQAEGLQTGEYDVRYNPGGTSVKGDGVLHCDDLYVSVSPDSAGPGILVRNCQGRKDYQGGANGWMSWQTFLESKSAGELMRSIRNIAPKQSVAKAPPSGKDEGLPRSCSSDVREGGLTSGHVR